MPKKKLYIEAFALVNSHFSGIGQYVYGILSAIDDDFERYCDRYDIKIIVPIDKLRVFQNFHFAHLKATPYPLPARIINALWRRNLLPPVDMIFGRGDYLFTNFASMPVWKSQLITVIYDLSFERLRQYSDERNAAFLTKATRQTIARSAHIITISNFIRNEISQFYTIDPQKISVAYPAANSSVFYPRDKKETQTCQKKYDIPENYIVFLGNLEPRKNVETLINAYRQLPKELRENIALLLIGVKAWKSSNLQKLIEDSINAGYRIIMPSHYVSDEDKPAILSGAKLLVYPSHYEGFGMPIIEALACGTPVISANNSSLPEAAGDAAAAMVDSHDTNQLRTSLVHVLENWEEAKKLSFVKGPKHVNSFSWKRSARIILNQIEHLDN